MSKTASPESRAAAPGERLTKPHFPCLDAYRAIGMMMVFLAHAHFASIFSADKGIFGEILDRFDFGLPIFFVLSSFLLFRPYAVGLLAERPPMPATRFLRHRVFRIFPAYWFALTAIVVFVGLSFDSFWQGFSFYALLQDYGTGPVFEPQFQPIYQAWSLSTEIAFYLLLPPFAMLLRAGLRGRSTTVRVRSVLVVCALIYVAGAGFRSYLVWADPTWQKNAVLWLPAWLDFFGLGMALAIISARYAVDGRMPRPFSWLADHAAVAWLIAAAFFTVVVILPATSTPFVLEREYVMRQAIYGVCAVFFLFPGMFGDPLVGRIRAFLRHPVMAYLGAISLGFYLFHVAFLVKAEEWTDAPPFRANFLLIVAIAGPLTFLAANFSYYVVERPFLLLKDRPISSLWRRNEPKAGAST